MRSHESPAMDGASPLPFEIIRLIVFEAVAVRGLKRALRLRFVSRTWNDEVMVAIFEAGLYNPHHSVHGSDNFLWPGYLMHKLRQPDGTLSRPLRVIHRVARRIVASRGVGDETTTEAEAVRACLWEICRHSINANRFPTHMDWFIQPQKPEPVLDSDEDYRMALIAGAIIMDDMAIVREQVPSTEGHLLYQSTHIWEDPEPVIGLPLDVAAYLGREEALRMILDTIRDPHDLESALSDGRDCAVEGNQPGTLKQCLYPVYHYEEMASLYDLLLKAMGNRDNVEVFDRLYKMCKGNMDKRAAWASMGNPPREPPQGDPEAQLRMQGAWFYEAVELGDLRSMKRARELGLPPYCLDGTDDRDEKDRIFRAQVSVAARRGHLDVMMYLLENGEPIGARSLQAASMYGNPDIVGFLIERGARDELKPGSALAAAVRGEHTAVVRLLMEPGTLVDEDGRRRALKVAEEEGFTSMAELLEEYKGTNCVPLQ